MICNNYLNYLVIGVCAPKCTSKALCIKTGNSTACKCINGYAGNGYLCSGLDLIFNEIYHLI